MSTATPTTAPTTPAASEAANGETRKKGMDPRLQNTQVPKYVAAEIAEIARKNDFRGYNVVAAAIDNFKNLTPDEQFNALTEAKRCFAAAGE